MLHIQDSGIGINENGIPKLFDENANNETIGNHKNKGTGIGLIVSKEFVKLNKGSIAVYSKKNEGSCFTISLPDNSDSLIV